MKFLVAILITALLSFVLGIYMPWWSLALAAFVTAALLKQVPARSMLAGFLGVFFLWGILAWWIDIRNQSILSVRMAEVLPLGGSSFLLIAVTAFLGALVAAFAALSGSYFRRLLH